jgi:hypothetical protein
VEKIERAVKLVSEMKVTGKDQVVKSVLGEVKLLPPGEGAPDRTGLQTELIDPSGKPLATFIAGASTSTSGGASSANSNMFGGPGELRFVRVLGGDDKDTVWKVSDAFYELSSDPKEWLEKAFLDVRNVVSAEFTHPNAADSWKATRKDINTPFTLVNAAEGELLDTAKSDGLNNVLSGAYFTDVVPKEQVNADFLKGGVKAKLVTEDGFTYEIEGIEKKGEGGESEAKDYIAVKVSAEIAKERKAPEGEKPEDKKKADEAFAATRKAMEDKLAKEKGFEGWTYEVPNYAINIIFKKKADVLREKTPEAPAPAPGAPAPGGLTPPIPGSAASPLAPPTVMPLTPPATSGAGAKAPEATPAAPAPELKPDAAKPATEAKPATTDKPADVKPAADAKPPGQ